MVQTAKGSPLVSGRQGPAPARVKRVVVVRAFLHGGQVQDIGKVIELPASVADELRTYGKVAAAPEPEVPQPAEPDVAPQTRKKGAERA